DERHINGITAEAVRAGAHDCGGRLLPSHRRASRAKFKEREQEKRYGANNKNGTKRPERRRHEAKRPRSIQRDSQNNRGQKKRSEASSRSAADRRVPRSQQWQSQTECLPRGLRAIVQSEASDVPRRSKARPLAARHARTSPDVLSWRRRQHELK